MSRPLARLLLPLALLLLLTLRPAPVAAQDAPTPPATLSPIATQAQSIHQRLDTQHRALTDLLTVLKAEVPRLTLAAKDLSGLTLDLAIRAATACLLTPVEKAELGDLVGAALATAEIKPCLEILPVGMLEQLLKLPDDDRAKLGRLLETAGHIRRGLAILTPQVQALTEQTALATLELIELQAKATLDHELVKNNIFASDAEKAAAASSYASSQAALSTCEQTLTRIATDLAQFPLDALTISADALKALPATQ